MSTQADHSPTAYNQEFLQLAQDATPALVRQRKTPVSRIELQDNADAVHKTAVRRLPGAVLPFQFSDARKQLLVDFGEHLVGRLHLRVDVRDNPQDAPVKLRIRFGELPSELRYSTEKYDGWLSHTWFQDEQVYVDSTPTEVSLPRRYSFRYVSIEILGISPKNTLEIVDVFALQESSAPTLEIAASAFPGELGTIDEVGRRTLRDCMQNVFEDGPKRDRRLWLGDLRLQALANYASYKNYELVKRCLYLFAGTPDITGRIAACVFTEPVVRPDTIYLFDYSLLFVPTLLEYYQASGDLQTLEKLWPTAYRQVEIALQHLRGNLLEDQEGWWVFIDWHEKLHKQLSAQGVLMYCADAATRIAVILGETDAEHFLSEQIILLRTGAECCFDTNHSLFLSGPDAQASMASQIWMVICGVVSGQRARDILNAAAADPSCLAPTTPYLMHYYIEALMKSGLVDEAQAQLRSFWGGMISHGADTFWEVFKPDDADYSPYGSFLINSYCHAWSCTPVFLIPKLPLQMPDSFVS